MPNDTQDVRMHKAGSTKVWVFPRNNLQKLKSLGWVEVQEAKPVEPEGTLKQVGRGAALGAFEGLGIQETMHPMKDTLEALKQQAKDVMGFWTLKPKAMKKSILANPLVAIPRAVGSKGMDFLRDTAVAGWKGQKIDPEKTSQDLTALLTMLATLRGGKKAAETPISEGIVAKGAKAGSRELLGVGEKSVERAKATADAAAKEKMEAYAEKKAKYDEKVAEAQAKHTAKIAEKQAKHEADVTEAKATHQAKLSAAEQSLAGKVTREAHARLKESRLNEATKKLTATRDNLVRETAKNLEQAETTERASLDARYDDFRKKILGVSEETPNGTLQSHLSPLADAVLDAKRNILKGSRTNIPIFNDMLGRIKQLVETPEGEIRSVGGEMIPTDQLRGYYKELGDIIYEKDLPGDVRRALDHVQGKIQDEVKSSISDVHGEGALKIYDKLSEDWSAYKRVWYDRSSGSPLPRILKTMRAPVALHEGVNMEGQVADLLARKHTGQSITTLLARKSQFGARPEIVARLMAVNKKLVGIKDLYEKIPTATYPRFPGEFKPPEAPKAEPFENMREEPEKPDTEPFSKEKFRRETIGKEADYMSRLQFWDVAAIIGAMEEFIRRNPKSAAAVAMYPVLKRLIARGLQSEPVLNWLSKDKEAGTPKPPTKPPTPPAYRPSEKAETMSGPRKSLGSEFEQGEQAHEIERYKAILRNPQATSEDRVIAMAKLFEMGVRP